MISTAVPKASRDAARPSRGNTRLGSRSLLPRLPSSARSPRRVARDPYRCDVDQARKPQSRIDRDAHRTFEGHGSLALEQVVEHALDVSKVPKKLLTPKLTNSGVIAS